MTPTLEDLLAEAEKLARPCFQLSAAAGGPIAGYWGGELRHSPDAVGPEATALRSRRHVATVRASLIESWAGDSSAALSLFAYEYQTGASGYRIELDPSMAFDGIACSGEPLGATPGRSLPPFEALCLYGGGQVHDWIGDLGLRPHDYQQAASEPVAQDYRDAHIDGSGQYSGNADLIAGGWHMMWPDDDFYIPREMRLAFVTVRDAEPYLEVFLSAAGNFSVLERCS